MRLYRSKLSPQKFIGTSRIRPDAAKQPVHRLLLFTALVWIAIPSFFYVCAGTWHWWQASTYSLVILLPMTAFTFWARKRSPGLLLRRMEVQENLPEQVKIMKAIKLLSLTLYTLPAIEHRISKSQMWFPISDGLTISALMLVLVGCLGVLSVMVSNPWAGRTVRTWPGQKLITEGQYSVVRHPMYSWFVVFILATPLALGSLVSIGPALLLLPLLAARIRSEEAYMLSAFPDYSLYRTHVRYRLIPKVW